MTHKASGTSNCCEPIYCYTSIFFLNVLPSPKPYATVFTRILILCSPSFFVLRTNYSLDQWSQTQFLEGHISAEFSSTSSFDRVDHGYIFYVLNINMVLVFEMGREGITFLWGVL